jgi:hypothetical protein
MPKTHEEHLKNLDLMRSTSKSGLIKLEESSDVLEDGVRTSDLKVIAYDK